jgi:DNA-binding transcriptional LysR family regulator
LGVALLPEPIVRSALMAGELVQLLPQWASAEEIIHAVYPTPRGMLPSVKAFLGYLAQELPVALGLQPGG